nr:DUF533 domain-containing protein [uncultured Desulfobulbus sp.]
MFDAEKLLGKIVGEVMGSGNQQSGLGGLGAGSGLMTMIGLGVGAYEILKQKGQQPTGSPSSQTPPPPPGGSGTMAPPPPPGGGTTAAPPPPVPGATPAPPPVAATPLTPATTSISGSDLATRLIQVMAAAAHADGEMDADEERAVLDKLRGAELSQEEKMFLLGELHQPKTIDELVEGINDPAVAKTMYMLAVATVEIDTEAERIWLDTLAGRLGISAVMQGFIEDTGK